VPRAHATIVDLDRSLRSQMNAFRPEEPHEIHDPNGYGRQARGRATAGDEKGPVFITEDEVAGQPARSERNAGSATPAPHRRVSKKLCECATGKEVVMFRRPFSETKEQLGGYYLSAVRIDGRKLSIGRKSCRTLAICALRHRGAPRYGNKLACLKITA